MSENGDNKRRWPRLAVHVSAEVRIEGVPYVGAINDLSAGGASLKLEAGEQGGQGRREAELSIDYFGEYEARVVRQWDDGLALAFDLDEENQDSLREDIEAFKRENDLDWD